MKKFKELLINEAASPAELKVISALNKVLDKYGMTLKPLSVDYVLLGPSTPKSAAFWWGSRMIWIQYDKGKFSLRSSVDSHGTSIAKLEAELKDVKKIMGEIAKVAPKMVL